MGSFGPLEIILIFLVVLLIFGAKRIPEIARGIGKGIREFKDATSEISNELEAEAQDRKINRPESPRQGQPQSRQPQQAASDSQSTQQQESPPEPPPSGEEANPDATEETDQKPEQSA